MLGMKIGDDLDLEFGQLPLLFVTIFLLSALIVMPPELIKLSLITIAS